MAFGLKAPSTPSAHGAEQQSTYREADPVPIGFGVDRYGSHWVSDRFNTIEVSAGSNKPPHIYWSICAVYMIGPIDYVGHVWKNGQRIAYLNYTFGPGETSKTFTILANMKGGHSWQVTIQRGSESQMPWSALVAATGQQHPPYRGFARADWVNIPNDEGSDALPDLSIELGRKPPTIGGFTSGFRRDLGVNPFAAIYGLLREGKGGGAASASLLDEDHWAAQCAALESIGVGQRLSYHTHMHLLASQGQDAAAVVSDALAYVDGFVYYADGTLRVGWFPNKDTVPDSLPEIAEGDLTEKPSGNGFSDWNTAPTSCVVIYKHLERNYNETPAMHHAPANRETGLADRPVRKERPGIHEPNIAAMHAAEMSVDPQAEDSGVTLSVFKSRAVDAEGSPLAPGSLINWDYAPHSLDLVCRVVERRMRVGQAADLLKVIRERGCFPRPYVPADDERVIPTLDEPGEISVDDVRIYELPDGFGTEVRQLVVLIQRAKLSINRAVVSLSADASPPWSEIHEQDYFAAKCAISGGGINSSVTTVRLSTTSLDFAGFSEQDALAQKNDSLLLLIDNELMSVSTITAVSAGVYDLAVLRGRKESAAAAHSDGTTAWLFRREDLQPLAHEEFHRITSGTSYNSTVATKYFKIALATSEADGIAKPDGGISYTIADPTPAAVSDLVAVKGTGRTVKLTWTKIAGVEEHRVWRHTSNNFSLATEIAQTPANSFTDVTAAALTTYYYWVTRETPGELRSTSSNVASVTTGAAVGDQIAPSNPSAPTLVASATKLADDGTTYGKFTIGVPSMPSGAAFLHIRYRTSSTSGWIVADVWDTGRSDSPRRTTIDDLPLGTSIEVSAIAYSADGAPTSSVNAIGSPFTTPVAGTPVAPSGLTISLDANDVSGAPPRYALGTQKMNVCKASWTASPSRDVAYYEIYSTSMGTTPSPYDDENVRTKGAETSIFLYNLYIAAGFPTSTTTRVRAVSRAGIASAWTSFVEHNMTGSYATATMALQSASAVAITGGSISGITDLSISDGGTGASSASGARTNLGLGTAATANVASMGQIGVTGIESTNADGWGPKLGGVGLNTISFRWVNPNLNVRVDASTFLIPVRSAKSGAISDPTGGTTVDTQARAAITAALAVLRDWQMLS